MQHRRTTLASSARFGKGRARDYWAECSWQPWQISLLEESQNTHKHPEGYLYIGLCMLIQKPKQLSRELREHWRWWKPTGEVKYLCSSIFSSQGHKHSISADASTANPRWQHVALEQNSTCRSGPYLIAELDVIYMQSTKKQQQANTRCAGLWWTVPVICFCCLVPLL